MSTDFITSEKIPFAHVFDGRLEKFEVYEHISDGKSSETSRCLTDGRNYLWLYAPADGFLACITSYDFNSPGRILRAITETFGVEILSDHEPQFWGFDTQAAWDAAMEAMDCRLLDGDDSAPEYLEMMEWFRKRFL